MLVTIDGLEGVFADERQLVRRHPYGRPICIVSCLDGKWQLARGQVVDIPQSCGACKQGTRVGSERMEVEAVCNCEELIGHELCMRLVVSYQETE
jgi:hypothetical protein